MHQDQLLTRQSCNLCEQADRPHLPRNCGGNNLTPDTLLTALGDCLSAASFAGFLLGVGSSLEPFGSGRFVPGTELGTAGALSGSNPFQVTEEQLRTELFTSRSPHPPGEASRQRQGACLLCTANSWYLFCSPLTLQVLRRRLHSCTSLNRTGVTFPLARV